MNEKAIVHFFNLCNLLFLFLGIDLLRQHSGAKPRGLTLGGSFVCRSFKSVEMLRCFVRVKHLSSKVRTLGLVSRTLEH